ncbi:MAG: galactokinase [Planctomycetota bacterium]|jgi:galactokinase|nr:galactokinase [Planctomycetota bacterium]
MARHAHETQAAAQAQRVAFSEIFGPGEDPRIFFAPGRVNLMGAHLDYNGGPVMPMAINRGTFIAARRRTDGKLRMASTLEAGEFIGEVTTLARDNPRRTGTWADYPLGVALGLLAAEPAEPVGLDLLFGGNLPVGAGLSSSASICVGTALALDAMWGLQSPPMDRVHAALRSEREFVGVRCGIMDPYAVGLARPAQLLWLDCKDASHLHLPLDTERLAIAVADTGVRRELAQGEFNQRVSECGQAFRHLAPHVAGATCLRDIPFEVLLEQRTELEESVARRAEHVIREVERTFRARDSLLAGKPAGFGLEMTNAHASLRELFQVSCPELDTLVHSATALDFVAGSRLTGAGFGGCTVIIFDREREDELRARLSEDFRARHGTLPTVECFEGDLGPRELS